MSDNDSCGSSSSVARATMECPECSKEIQARSFFKHVRNYHTTLFDRCMKDCEEDLKDIKTSSLPVEFSWSFNVDFEDGSHKEEKSVWGCLACNAAFTNPRKGVLHCKSDKCKKQHLSNVDTILTQIASEREKEIKLKRDQAFRRANRTCEQILADTQLLYNFIKNTLYKKYLNKYQDYLNINSFPVLPDIIYTDNLQRAKEQDKMLNNLFLHVIDKASDQIDWLWGSPPGTISDVALIEMEKAFKRLNDEDHPYNVEVFSKLSWPVK